MLQARSVFVFIPALLTLIVALSFSDVVLKILQVWRLDNAYNHGLLAAFFWIAGVSVLEWRESSASRRQLTRIQTMLLLIVCGILVYLEIVGEKNGIEALQFLSITALVSLSVWIALRPADSRRFLLLSIVLFSGVPFWDILIRVLQPIAVVGTEIVLGAIGIPSLISESVVTIPSGTFEIADGCSGLRYFLSAVAFSAVYAFLYIEKLSKALLFIVLTCTIAVIFNVIRITSIIWIGFVSEMQSSLVTDHVFFGWLTFALAIMASLVVGHYMRGTGERFVSGV